MNKELDAVLCRLDGKITYYRMITTLDKNDKRLVDLIKIQELIQTLYDMNKNNKGIMKKSCI